MNDGKLQLEYNIEPDEHGVLNGKKLARSMIRDAYRLIVPYVSGCPACADDLFTLIANEAIEEVHQQKKDDNSLPGTILATSTATDESKKAHLKSEENSTRAMLEKARNDNGHEH